MIDLLIKRARLLDERVVDIGIDKGVFVEIAPCVKTSARKTVELDGDTYVSAGWIDAHVHCYEAMNLYYDYPDEIGVSKGVTTVVDAGSTGANNIGDFYERTRSAKTNVYAMINVAKTGIVAQNELANLDGIDKGALMGAVKAYSDFIVGLKVRMSQSVIGTNGIKPLLLAKEMQKACDGIRLMVHIGSAPPELEETLSYLNEWDVVTHCYNGKENGIVDKKSGLIKLAAKDAYARGVLFDVGHGTDSFNFAVAKQAFKEGIYSHTISTDIYHRNRENGPVYDLATTMEKFLVVGYKLEEIIRQVTINPAKLFNLASKGMVKVGYDGDLTVFKLVDKEKMLTDSNGFTCKTRWQIMPIRTIVGGNVYDCNDCS